VAESLKDPTADEMVMIHDIEMNRAIENSIKEAGIDVSSFEPFNPESLKRKSGLPVGLKNIGNTCYFNSLIQTYFMIPSLVEEILKYSTHPSHQSEELENKTKKASISLVEALKSLFGHMILSNRKYIDPSKVLSSLVDDFGNIIRVGEQKDVGEFHLILVARIEEGLRTSGPAEPSDDSHEGSPIKRSETANFVGLKVNEKSIMSKLFYGKQREYLSAQGTSAPVVNEVVFGQIILDVEEKDLYSAWDASYFSEIEDYLLENHQTTKASQEIWPETFPGVLLFQIQRVKYDRVASSTVKINSKFSFPLEIYPDRFLKANRELSLELRNEMLALKAKARFIEAQIEKFSNYKESGISLEIVIENTLNFLQKQGNPTGMDLDGCYTPDSQLLEGVNFYQSPEVLKGFKEKVMKKVKSLNGELEEIYLKIENLYDVKVLKQQSYRLHSLLVHDGYAGSGHYYTFVYDFENNVWRKYSDLAINEVSFEQVIHDSVGGNGLANAYCLFYIKSELLEKKMIKLWDYSLETVENSHYFSLIPETILKEIREDNSKLEEEIISFNSTQTFSKISNLYESWNSEIDKIYKENNNKGNENVRFILVNFPFYLKLNENSQNLYQKFLLHEAYKQITGENLNDLKLASPLLHKLEGAYKNYLTLTNQDKENIEKNAKKFVEITSIAEIFTVFIKMLLNERFIDAFKLLMFNSELNDLENDDISMKTKEFTSVLAIICVSLTSRYASLRDFSLAMVFASISAHILVSFLENEVMSRILLQRLESISKEFKSKGSEFQTFVEELESLLKDIKKKEVIAQVAFDELPQECLAIKKKKEEFNPYVWYVGISEDDPAVKFVQAKNIQDNNLKQWVKLHEDLRRTRSYSERLFKEAEQKVFRE
jgi:ubiquitin carboxyl-terminal hydrolase 25/28